MAPSTWRKHYKNSRLENQKENKKAANHILFTSRFMSSTTDEDLFSMAFCLVVDSLMFNKVQTQIKSFPQLCISNSFFPVRIPESLKRSLSSFYSFLIH